MWNAAQLAEAADANALVVREHLLLTRSISAYWTAFFFAAALERDPLRTWDALLLSWIRQVPLSHLLLQTLLGRNGLSVTHDAVRGVLIE